MDPVLLNTIGALLILIVGTGLGYWFGSRRRSAESAKASEIRDAFDDYRRDVTAHFGQTANHFQAIGQQYRELYEHMASGAEALCDVDGEADRLSFPKAVVPALTAGAGGIDTDAATAAAIDADDIEAAAAAVQDGDERPAANDDETESHTEEQAPPDAENDAPRADADAGSDESRPAAPGRPGETASEDGAGAKMTAGETGEAKTAGQGGSESTDDEQRIYH